GSPTRRPPRIARPSPRICVPSSRRRRRRATMRRWWPGRRSWARSSQRAPRRPTARRPSHCSPASSRSIRERVTCSPGWSSSGSRPTSRSASWTTPGVISTPTSPRRSIPTAGRRSRASRVCPERGKTPARTGRELADRPRQGDPAGRQQAVSLARKVYAALVQNGGDERDSIQLADLMLAAGDAAGARKQYDEVLAKNDASAEALRGAARAAAAAGDTAGALGYWRRVVEASAPGGTAWYEARIEQVTLLAGDGRRDDACQLLRSSGGRSTTAGGDALVARLRAMEPEVCK